MRFVANALGHGICSVVNPHCPWRRPCPPPANRRLASAASDDLDGLFMAGAARTNRRVNRSSTVRGEGRLCCGFAATERPFFCSESVAIVSPRALSFFFDGPFELQMSPT